MRDFCRQAAAGAALALGLVAAQADPVQWVDWMSGTAGANGVAAGVIQVGTTTINVAYSGEISFLQTSGGTNYWTGEPSPYTSAAVDNAPGTPDIIALSSATPKTLSFDIAVDNLFFAVVSLNGNGYAFNEDFTIESVGCGFWGCGILTKQVVGDGTFRLIGSGEPHGVIRFNRAVNSISWTSLTNENWNGFTVGTYGVAPVPEPASMVLLCLGLAATGWAARARRR